MLNKWKCNEMNQTQKCRECETERRWDDEDQRPAAE